MGKPVLWPASRVQTDKDNRFVSDTNISYWNNKLDNLIIDDWNTATTNGVYTSGGGRKKCTRHGSTYW